MTVLRSFMGGLGLVLRAPLLVAGITVALLLTTVPFAIVLGSRVQQELATQPPVSLGSREIDPEWWMEYREHARGLEATFTPMIIGFAAPLDNLSSVLDGTRRPMILIAPVAVALTLWAFLWGGALSRFNRGRSEGPSGFFASSRRHFAPLLAISLVGAVIVVILYATIHQLLFGPVYSALESTAGSERQAFLFRVGLYVIFGAFLVAVSLVVDYARVITVVDGERRVFTAMRSAAAFVLRNLAPALTLYLVTGVLFAAVVIGYGMLETIGGSLVGGWRGVALGQAFIITRLIIRLTFGASEVRLFRALQSHQPS